MWCSFNAWTHVPTHPNALPTSFMLQLSVTAFYHTRTRQRQSFICAGVPNISQLIVRRHSRVGQRA
eukprot:SAG11_NODE_1511_length_4769_cov_3.389722_2_plen_66_part_00